MVVTAVPVACMVEVSGAVVVVTRAFVVVVCGSVVVVSATVARTHNINVCSLLMSNNKSVCCLFQHIK